MADALDALRRRDIDVDVAMEKLVSAEEELDEAAEHIREMLAPEELHPLHLEYDANLERALRGIVTAERGCGITKLPHRPPEDEEPFTYWKRGHANVTHARMRMQELAEVMVRWQPGRQADLRVATRLHATRNSACSRQRVRVTFRNPSGASGSMPRRRATAWTRSCPGIT